MAPTHMSPRRLPSGGGHPFSRRALACAAILGSLWLAPACLPGAAAVAAEPIPVNLRLLAFQPTQASDEVFLHDPAAASAGPGLRLPLRSYLNHESVPAVLKNRKLVLTTKPDPASIEDPGQRLAEATLPKGLDSAVLLCLPDAEGAKNPFRLLVIDDSEKSFPAGSFRITNLSPSKVRLELEKRPWVIEPGATELIVDPPVRHGDLCGMKAYALQNRNWHRIASGIWPHPGRERVIQLLYYHPGARKIQLRAFDDVPPRKRVQAPAE